MFHVGILIHRQCVHLIWVSGTGRLHRILDSELETSRLPNLCLASEAKQEHKSARRLFRCTGLDGFWTSLRGNLLENRHKHWFWTCHAMSCETNSMWYDMYIYYICIYIYICIFFFLYLHINMFDRRGEGVEVSVHPFGIVGTRWLRSGHTSGTNVEVHLVEHHAPRLLPCKRFSFQWSAMEAIYSWRRSLSSRFVWFEQSYWVQPCPSKK